MTAIKGFKQFLMRGNVIDLAIAVVLGAAFGNIVSSFVKNLLTPLIAAIGGQPDFSNLFFTINGSQFRYGEFINSLVSFLIISAIVYYLIIVPLAKFKKPELVESPTRKCPECLSDIPIQARRCANCGQPVIPTTPIRSA